MATYHVLKDALTGEALRPATMAEILCFGLHQPFKESEEKRELTIETMSLSEGEPSPNKASQAFAG